MPVKMRVRSRVTTRPGAWRTTGKGHRMRTRRPRLWSVAGCLALLGLISACGGADRGSDDDEGASLSAGACVDATDGDDIQIVDCDSADATAQVIGTYE